MGNLQSNDAARASYLPQRKTDSTTNVMICTFAAFENAFYFDTTNATGGTAVISYPIRAETEFDRQKNLFLAIPQTERERYNGRFVISRDGVIVDSDSDLAELNHRFFEQYGDIPVYITGIGRSVKMRTPFVKR
jgi:hypothetical protein